MTTRHLSILLICFQVLSYFNEFQISKGIVPNINGFYEITKYYSSTSDEKSESLLLEDLKTRGFEMFFHRKETLSFDHMAMLLHAVGKFHALSFALKDQQPAKFQAFIPIVSEQFWLVMGEDFYAHFEDMLNRLLASLESENRLDLLEKFQLRTGPNRSAKILELVSSAAAGPYAVICHGDLTVNNTMFRKDPHGNPLEIQLIDWQFARYASPVIDLIIYLFCCASKELRDKHYDEFLKIYHESLSEMLTRYFLICFYEFIIIYKSEETNVIKCSIIILLYLH